MNAREAMFAGTLIGLIITLSFGHVRQENAYKQGQIDALTNKMKYELVTLPDSTKEWVRIKSK